MFESLWIDSEHADKRIAEMSGCAVTEKLAELFRCFKEEGYCVVPRAVSHAVIDAYMNELENAIAAGSLKASFGHEIMNAKQANRRMPLTKVLDSHVYCPSACEAAFALPTRIFVDTLFGEPALAFQSLYFEVGSTQAIHNDTAYVVIDESPKSMCAAWIALEDIGPGSGELTYYPGSHRFGDFLYPNNTKHWSPEKDGHAIHDHHLFWIHEEAKRRGIRPVSFLPRKGDILFWHADLCHGGGEISDPTLTRRSLVVHYCPVTARPHYFASSPDRTARKKIGGGYISSMFYDLSS
jgi:ectoine hydroxylase-related dioxygenase (phytanoyl-CoA dioxygenase family)